MKHRDSAMALNASRAGSGRAIVNEGQVRAAMSNIEAGVRMKDEADRLGIKPSSLHGRIKRIKEKDGEMPTLARLQRLQARLDEIETENRDLRDQVRALTETAKGGPRQHERRDMIVAALEYEDLLTYAEIADKIDSTASRVRSTVAKMNGMVEKFHKDGTKKVYLRLVRE